MDPKQANSALGCTVLRFGSPKSMPKVKGSIVDVEELLRHEKSAEQSLLLTPSPVGIREAQFPPSGFLHHHPEADKRRHLII